METGLKFRDRDISRLVKTPSFLPPLTNDFWSVQFSLSQKLPRNITKSISKRFETSNSSITALKIPKMRFSLFLPRIFPLRHLCISFLGGGQLSPRFQFLSPAVCTAKVSKREKKKKITSAKKEKKGGRKNCETFRSFARWLCDRLEAQSSAKIPVKKRKRERKKDERRLFSRKLVQRGGISHVAKPLSRVEATWAETPD